MFGMRATNSTRGRYATMAPNVGLEERNVDRNKAEATNDQVTVVAETPQHEVRRASRSLFSDSMSELANISMSPD